MALIPDPIDKPKKTVIQNIGGNGPVDRSSLSSEQITKINNAIKSDPTIEFFIVASEDLKKMMLSGHAIASQIPPVMAVPLLKGDGLRVEKEMITRWLANKIDFRNAFVLNNCDIRIEGTLEKLVGG